MTLLEQVIVTSQKLPRTVANYLSSVQKFTAFAGQHPAQWTSPAVAAWRDRLLADGLRPASVNNCLAGVKTASKLYAAMGYGPDFAKPVSSVRVVQERAREALGHDDALRLLAACRNDQTPVGLRDTALFTLGFRTGARRESLQRLTFDDLKRPKLTYWIKGGSRHTLTADAETWEALDNWITWLRRHGQRSGQVFRALRRHLDDSYTIGDGLSLRAVNALAKRRGDQAGVRFHPHLWRHSFVSWAVMAGVPKARIKAMTGHKSDTMLDLYTTDLQADADPVGNYLPKLR